MIVLFPFCAMLLGAMAVFLAWAVPRPAALAALRALDAAALHRPADAPLPAPIDLSGPTPSDAPCITRAALSMHYAASAAIRPETDGGESLLYPRPGGASFYLFPLNARCAARMTFVPSPPPQAPRQP